ncbi:MAG: D-alanine transaminase [Granulosicoccus sp.]|jgi:D-alanine transaminase
MSRTFYVNGEFVAEENAKVSVLDRGFLFADGVYEVSTILKGRLIDNTAHMRRLARSLSELAMAAPCSDAEILEAQLKLIDVNKLDEGLLYLQVTRGVADRDFAYPANTKSSLVMFTQAKNLLNSPMAEQGMHIISIPDQRWKRRDIKTVGLLAPCMGKQAAVDAGVHDAWMLEDGLVTEGTSNNAYIVTKDKKIQTRHLGHEILSGITRHAVLKFATRAGYTVVEEPFTIEEAREASEAFITSASTFVMPVVNIDGVALGDGKPGPVSLELRKIYIQTALEYQDL